MFSLVLLSWASLVFAGKPLVVTVQGFKIRPYDEAVKGFERIVSGNNRKIILSENKGADIVEKLRRTHADLILAVGMGAMTKVSAIRNKPVIYLMVLDPSPKNKMMKNATGISMNASPDAHLDIFQKALPDIHKIGLIYHPEKTGFFVDQAVPAAKEKKIHLHLETIEHPKELFLKLNQMKNDIGAFWMLPDVTVVTPETTEMLMLFSLENRIPILTFSEKYVALGAVLSVGTDPFDMGKQAGKMARKILNGADISTISPEYASETVITINTKAAEKLGIQLNKKVLKEANIIN